MLTVGVAHKPLWFALFDICYFDNSVLFSASGPRIEEV